MELVEVAYPAARIVAPKVHAHFTRQRTENTPDSSEFLAPLPDIPTIQALVDAAFWASLRKEEGFVPRISLALLPPTATKTALLFERPLALEPGVLTRVSPAVERPGIHLGVWHTSEAIQVWGATRKIPSLCLVVEVAAPGVIVIKHHSRDTAGKYVNVAVLEGDQVKVIDPQASPLSAKHSGSLLIRLAVSMRAHGRGGSLLVVPASADNWRESIVSPVPYAVSPPFSDLAELARTSDDESTRLTKTVDAVAGLTAVDGAVVLTDQYDVLAFGAKITRRKGHPLVEQVMVTEPVEGGEPVLVQPDKLGGTRHLSAAQFVHDQQDSIALVASQDGRFTKFEWSRCDSMVHAHRIEALLL